jgi:hypothetical protein
MGKTRFGKEAPKYVSQVLRDSRSSLSDPLTIMIDFNGGGDSLDPNLDVTPENSLAIRMLAKGFFQCKTEHLRKFILFEEESLITFDEVISVLSTILFQRQT